MNSSPLLSIVDAAIKQSFGLSGTELIWSTPPSPEMGDISLGVFPLVKELRTSPVDIASQLQEALVSQQGADEVIDKTEIVGPYLNIYLRPKVYEKAFSEYFGAQDLYGKADNSSETIIIDYIGTNVGKPLHIGHICTPLQGQSFVNLFKKLGANIISDSHIGDWGIIFGKLIVAYSMYGDADRLKNDAVDHLFDLYVKISDEAEKHSKLENEFRIAFQKLSQGDPDSVELWKEFTSYSIDAMQEQLSRIFVEPEYNIGESFYEGIGLPKLGDYPDLTTSMSDVVQELLDKGIATKNDDSSVGVVFPESSKLPSTILQKNDGTNLYFTSDLASILYRMQNWNPDKILYFVDVRQKLHFQQVFEIAKMAGWVKRQGKPDTELFHAYNGFISLKDGAMSTRKGKIIRLSDLLDESEDRARDIILQKHPDIDEGVLNGLKKQIGIGAIQFGYLKKSRESDTVFDWNEFMNFDGFSGPYVQYGYTRASSIIQKTPNNISYGDIHITHTSEKELVKKILDFPNIVEQTLKNYEMHHMANYLYELIKTFSAMYAQVQILSEPDPKLLQSRLAIVAGFMKIVEESASILGLSLPESM